MATSVLHRPKQQTGSWSAIFPTEQVTEQQSALFVKKLLAVAISNITYLRTIFPEHAFGDRCLEDLSLKILRDDSACPGACQVIKWVKGCFDALDKKYLRMIILGIYLNDSSPDNVLETYTFKFDYSNEGISIYRNGDKVSSAYNEAETKKATIKLLRTIVILTQTLKPLPDDVMMTMKLLYYDEVTPEDYEPPGFRFSDSDEFQFKEEPMNIRVGDVNTPFHTVKLRVKTSSAQFAPVGDVDVSTSVSNNQESCAKINRKEKSHDMKKKSHDPQKGNIIDTTDNAGCQTDGEEAMETGSGCGQPAEDRTSAAHKNGVAMEPSESSVVTVTPPISPVTMTTAGNGEDNKVRCPCGVHEDDGLMVLCGVCKVWQHAICFGLLREDDVPELHICEQCAQQGAGGTQGHECTDHFLQFLSSVALQSTCLWRRALLACTETTRVVPPSFAKRLGVEISVAQGLINRLDREGYVRPPAKGKRLGKIVVKDKLRNEGMIKYFEKPKKDQKAVTTQEATHTVLDKGVGQITEGASGLSITETTSSLHHQKRKKAVIPQYVSEEQQARRSPRIAKRARSLVDESVEFELSCSQDIDTDSLADGMPLKKRQRKSSIASRSILV